MQFSNGTGPSSLVGPGRLCWLTSRDQVRHTTTRKLEVEFRAHRVSATDPDGILANQANGLMMSRGVCSAVVDNLPDIIVLASICSSEADF